VEHGERGRAAGRGPGRRGRTDGDEDGEGDGEDEDGGTSGHPQTLPIGCAIVNTPLDPRGDEFRTTPGSQLMPTQSQEAAVSDTITRIPRIGTVIVPVADVDRQIEFYVGTLGFEKRVDVPFGGEYRWVEVAPEGAETTIAIAPPPPGGSAGNVQTGIALQSADVDALHAELRGKGVDVDDEVSRMGEPVPPMFWFRDPEGNTLMVVEAP
jgi:catechol 2,3-dioxygenase-like lactoylglutathione lyase family enzyme